MEIDGITLWLFGGVASFRGTFPGPGAEFRISVAGPIVTLVLGAAFIALAAYAQLPDTADGVVFWLGYINLSLLLFNLLPALPLDGGRILRAGLWRLRARLPLGHADRRRDRTRDRDARDRSGVRPFPVGGHVRRRMARLPRLVRAQRRRRRGTPGGGAPGDLRRSACAT